MSEPLSLLTVIRSFECLPPEQHVALLLRHAHRYPFRAGTYGDEVGLTPEGMHIAEVLGAVLARRRVGGILTSPVVRCSATAAALIRGAGWNMAPVSDGRLGAPGTFVVNPALAGPLFLKLGPGEVVRRQLTEPDPLPGMRSTSEGVSLILDLMLEHPSLTNGLDVFVTHDSLLGVVVGYLLEVSVDSTNLPGFLEGLFLWKSSNGLGVAWRGEICEIPWPRS